MGGGAVLHFDGYRVEKSNGVLFGISSHLVSEIMGLEIDWNNFRHHISLGSPSKSHRLTIIPSLNKANRTIVWSQCLEKFSGEPMVVIDLNILKNLVRLDIGM